MIKKGSKVIFYHNSNICKGVVVALHQYKKKTDTYRDILKPSFALYIQVSEGQHILKNNTEVQEIV